MTRAHRGTESHLSLATIAVYVIFYFNSKLFFLFDDNIKGGLACLRLQLLDTRSFQENNYT